MKTFTFNDDEMDILFTALFVYNCAVSDEEDHGVTDGYIGEYGHTSAQIEALDDRLDTE